MKNCCHVTGLTGYVKLNSLLVGASYEGCLRLYVNVHVVDE